MVTELDEPFEPEFPPPEPYGRTIRRAGRRRRRRRPRGPVALVRLALIVVLLEGGLGGSELHRAATGAKPESAPVSSPVPSTSTINRLRSSRLAFEVLLAKRQEALVDGDIEAFLSDLDTQNENLIDNQKLIFENLQNLPVASYAQERDSYRRPTRVAGADPQDDWVMGSAYVETLVQLEDADPLPTVIRHQWDIALRNGRLVITDIKPAKANDDYGPAPWETAKLTVAKTDHMLVLATPDVAGRARDVANAAERAFDRSRALWPRRGINDEFVIFATADRDLFESWYGGLDVTDVDGWARPVPTCCSEREEVVGDIASMHIGIDLSRVDSRIALEWILAHELTHAVAEPLGAAGNMTRVLWADEGYAELVGIRLLASYNYVAGWGEVAREHARSDDFTGELPADEGFYDEDSTVHYALSVRFFEFLANRFGRSDVRDFYFDLNAMEIPDADAAMEEHFGASEKELVDEWARWVRR